MKCQSAVRARVVKWSGNPRDRSRRVSLFNNQEVRSVGIGATMPYLGPMPCDAWHRSRGQEQGPAPEGEIPRAVFLGSNAEASLKPGDPECRKPSTSAVFLGSNAEVGPRSCTSA